MVEKCDSVPNSGVDAVTDLDFEVTMVVSCEVNGGVWADTASDTAGGLIMDVLWCVSGCPGWYAAHGTVLCEVVILALLLLSTAGLISSTGPRSTDRTKADLAGTAV